MIKRIITSAAFAVSLFFAASAQQMPEIPVDGQVRIGKLDNGLTYYIRHNEEPKGQANFYIAQKVGSILEEENQRGLAHFLEHMCFNGTQKFAGNGVIKYLENIGVQFGGDLNAYTSIDETVYNIDNVPVATVPAAIDSCLWILHDWADGLLLNDKDIDGERGVIHEEWRSRSNAQMRMYEVLLPELFPDGNRYGHRLPIGLMEVVDNFPYQALRDYYEKWYRPDQQGIVVVGDINVDEIEAKIKDIFNTIAKPVDPAERFYVQVPDNVEPIISIAKDKEQPYVIAYIFKKHEAVPDEEKSSLPYLLMNYADDIMNIMISQRIEEISMQPEPPFIQAQIADDDYFIAKTKKAFTGIAITDENGVEKGVAAVYREMLRASRNGFTASEYERARAEYLTHLESSFNEREKTKSINYCTDYVRNFIDNEPIPGIENLYSIMNMYAPQIPVEFINGIVKEYCQENNLAVALMLPDKEGVNYPDETGILKVLKDVEAEDIAPYEDKTSDEPLISETPAGGRIVKTEPGKFGYTKYTLSNGATVYTKNTDYKADQIIFNAFSYGGNSLYEDSEMFTLSEINNLIGLGGLGNFSSTDLTKVLSGKKVSLNAYVTALEEGFSGSTTPKDLETLLQLTYLSFTNPRTDDSAFQSYKTRTASVLANQELDPSFALMDSVRTTIFDSNPRHIVMRSSDIDKIDYHRAIEIGKERFSNASDFTFIFTGNFDGDTMMPLVEKYIGAIPSTGRAEKFIDRKVYPTKGIKENIFKKKMETPAATVLLVSNGKGKYSLKDYLSFNIATQILDIIYTEEIREKEGGTYGVGVGSTFVSIPKPQKLFQISYQTDPDKYAHLNERILEILDEFVKEGPSEDYLAKIKELETKKYTENLRNNSFYSNMLQEYLESGVDFCTDFQKTLDSITVKDVQNSMKKLLKQKNFVTLVMEGTAE